MTNKSAVFFSCEGDDVVDFAAELARKGFSIIVVNSKKAKSRFEKRNIKLTFTTVSSVASVLNGIAQGSMECCVVVMSTAGPLTLEVAAQASALRRIVMDQYNTNAVTKCWVVLDYADLETVATMVDDEDPSRVLSYINAKVLKHTAEVDCKIAAAIADGTFPAPPLESVLVLGSGGREHAIVHSLRKSPLIGCIYVSPGNYGTAHECDDTDSGECVCENVPAMSTVEVVEFALSRGVSMVIVGPEKPLVDGVADALREKNIPCFGPSRQASQIEASKAWSKEFLRRHGLPTAAFRAFSSAADFSAAQAYIESFPHRVVVKASGLADGKGVLLPTSPAEAVAAVRSMLVEGAFGQAGNEVVVEQFLQGEEVSILAFCDGTTAVGMPPAQDHKRALDGDKGLNTGGMGAYAPTPLITPKQYKACMMIVQDTVSAMAAEGVPFSGVLYAGFILTADQGPMLLEYNCRFGDPETQVLLPLLESDLYTVCKKCVQGGLQDSDVTWSKQVACTVVCAAPGYPEPNYPRGAAITGLDTVADLSVGDKVKVYHAGTAAATDAAVCPVGAGGAMTGKATASTNQGGCPYGFGAPPKVVEEAPARTAPATPPAASTATTSSGGCPYGFGAPKSSVPSAPASVAPAPLPPLPPVKQTAAAGRCPFNHDGGGAAAAGTSAGVVSPPNQPTASTGCPMGFSAAPAPVSTTPAATPSAAPAGGASGGCPMGYGAPAGTSSATDITTTAVPTASHCQDDRVVTNGGRVLAVTGTGTTLKEAVENAYAGVRAVHFDGMHYRTDIAKRGLQRPLRIGVVGSTRGTSLQPVIDAIEQGALNATIALVVSNKLQAGILDRARHHNLPHLHIGAANKTREQYDAELCSAFDAEGVDLVLLIGYMRIVSPVFTRHFHQRCVNVHPSLLPEFAGGMDLDVHTAVLAAHKSTSGCTVHFVTDEVDGGPILVQKTCEISYPDETAESLKEKVQALEGTAFIEVIQMFINGDVKTVPIVTAARAAPETKAVCPVSMHIASASAPVATIKPAAGMEKGALSYRAAGVDIDAGEALVDAIKPYCRATLRSGCNTAELGGFGGLFDLAASGYAAADTVLVSGTDGVGTKLKIAQAVNKHDTIGIDLVAMCVNDILVCGAEPLFFLDYYATGALNVTEAALVVKGIAEGCKQAGCALIGGETAEMAGMYRPGEYDLAGFSVGAVRRSDILPRLESIRDGDVIIALRSSGVHSNGFSLVRKCVEQAGLHWTDAPPFDSPHATLGEALLEPTRIYVQELLTLARRKFIKAMAHITGGGLTDNIPRVLPPHLRAVLNAACPEWTLPPVFRWLQTVAQLPQEEMLRTFNCGIGMVLIVDRVAVPAIMHELHESASKPFIVGSVRARPAVPQGEPSPQVVVVGNLA